MKSAPMQCIFVPTRASALGVYIVGLRFLLPQATVGEEETHSTQAQRARARQDKKSCIKYLKRFKLDRFKRLKRP